MSQVINVHHITKEYQLGALQGLKQAIINSGARLIGHAPTPPKKFRALDDVTFSVEQGEVIGIIGHNGAGKSTLLKLLSRISTPTAGTINTRGRIAPLIEVGAGFVPDFTGRENVFLNGTILGLSKKEILRKFDEIVDFAEMQDFIDTPVKRYSSGMQVKLAFAVATSIESEILIVDEVLAVGDLAFQRKCFDRMEELIKRKERTVLLVSHNIRQIQRLSDRVLLLDHGRVSMFGAPGEVCDYFYAYNDEKIHSAIQKSHTRSLTSSGELDLISVKLINSSGTSTNRLIFGEDCEIQFRLRSKQPLEEMTFGFGFHTTDFIYLTTHNSEYQLESVALSDGDHVVTCKINRLPLLPGVYSLRFGVTAGKAARDVFYAENIFHFQVIGEIPASIRQGFFALDAQWALPDHHAEANYDKTLIDNMEND